MTVLITRTLIFRLNVTSVFNFTVLLSYRAIHMFLVKKFSCPIATHGHEPIDVDANNKVKATHDLFINLHHWYK